MHGVLELFRLWEALLLGAAIALAPTTTLRAILADTLRNGYYKARANVFFAALGLLCIAFGVVGVASHFIEKEIFLSALGIFGAFVLASLIYDLWRTTEMPEDEPLFSSRRVFFMPWLGGSQWLVALTVLLPSGVWLETQVNFGRWFFAAAYVLGWTGTLIFLSQKYDQARFFFQGTERVRWVFRVPAIALALLTAALLARNVKQLLVGAAL